MEKINLVALRGMEAYFYYRLSSVEEGRKNIFIPSVSGEGETKEQYDNEIYDFLYKDLIYRFECFSGGNYFLDLDADIWYVGRDDDYDDRYLAILENLGGAVNEPTIAKAIEILLSE